MLRFYAMEIANALKDVLENIRNSAVKADRNPDEIKPVLQDGDGFPSCFDNSDREAIFYKIGLYYLGYLAFVFNYKYLPGIHDKS